MKKKKKKRKKKKETKYRDKVESCHEVQIWRCFDPRGNFI